ncbi:MAG: hypothetical protein SFW66_10620 [Gammaproteobacteria bacterium]|nr:hypothetical protein [Gammaproteobacteria bacterium]
MRFFEKNSNEQQPLLDKYASYTTYGALDAGEEKNDTPKRERLKGSKKEAEKLPMPNQDNDGGGAGRGPGKMW